MTAVDVQPITVNVETSAPASSAPDPAASIRTSIDRFRSTAQWIVGAFAAIGATVAAAVPFAAISGVEPDRQAWLLVGAVLSLGGVGVVITATAANLVPRTVYPHEIGTGKHTLGRYFSGRLAVADALERHGSLLLPTGYSTAGEVIQGLENLERAIQQNPSATNLRSRHAELSQVATNLQWMVRFEKARNVFRLSLVTTVVGALAVGAGLGCLLYGLQDAKAAAETTKIEAEAAKIEAEADQLEQDLGSADSVATAELAKLEAETARIAAETEKLRAEADKLDEEAASIEAERAAAGAETPSAPSDLDNQTAEAQIDLLRAQAEELRAQADLLVAQAAQLESATGP